MKAKKREVGRRLMRFENLRIVTKGSDRWAPKRLGDSEEAKDRARRVIQAPDFGWLPTRVYRRQRFDLSQWVEGQPELSAHARC